MTKARSRTKYIILCFLGFKQPFTAHDIYTRVNRISTGMWTESEGQIYPALDKLVEDGWATITPSMRNNRKIKIYHITEAGMEGLQAWLREPAQRTIMRDESLLKFTYGHYVEDKYNLEHIQRRLTDCRKELNEFLDYENFLKMELSEHDGYPYWIASIGLGIQHLQSEIEWCNKMIDLISQRIKDGH